MAILILVLIFGNINLHVGNAHGYTAALEEFLAAEVDCVVAHFICEVITAFGVTNLAIGIPRCPRTWRIGSARARAYRNRASWIGSWRI